MVLYYYQWQYEYLMTDSDIMGGSSGVKYRYRI